MGIAKLIRIWGSRGVFWGVSALTLVAMSDQAVFALPGRNVLGETIEIRSDREPLNRPPLAQWVLRELDPLNGRRLPPAIENAVSLSSSYSVAGPSCVREFESGDQVNLDQAVIGAMARADRCGEIYSFPEMSCVKSVLARARFRCGEQAHTCAWVHQTPIRGNQTFSTRSLGEFDIHLDLSCVARVDQKHFQHMIFHEALHHCGVDNHILNDHNSRSMENRLEDRVYFLSAACNPWAYEHYYGGLFQNRQRHAQCMKALTEVDSRLPATSVESADAQIVGPPVRGRSYSPAEAEIFCSKVDEVIELIEQNQGGTRTRRTWVTEYRIAAMRFETWLWMYRISNSDFEAEWRAVLNQVLSRDDIERGSAAKAVHTLRQRGEAVRAKRNEICDAEPQRSIYSHFCINGGPVVEGLLQLMEQTATQIPVEAVLLSAP